MNNINDQLAEALAQVRAQKPLLHHITNYVVMTDTANVTLHIGALPVMAHATEEVEEMVLPRSGVCEQEPTGAQTGELALDRQ